MKKASEIANQIHELVDQLVEMSGEKPLVKETRKQTKANKKTVKGASGAIQMLIEEEYFDKPKDLPSVIKRMKEIGRYYSKESISMNLLNLTKRRILNRFKNKDTKKWEYVVRI